MRPRLPGSGPPSVRDGEDRLPGLGDPGLRAILVVAAVLQSIAWWINDGYQLADSVEYLERAQAFVRGTEVLDSTSIRSFGFSALMVPVFWLAELARVEDFRPVVWMVQLLQMALGLALVARTARIGALLGGPRAGRVAAFLVAVNPVFLQYSVSPVSGIAAAWAVAGALEAVLRRGGLRQGFAAGAWAGIAMLFAYQTLLVSGPLFLLALVRERRTGRRMLVGIAAGFGAGLVLQGVLDLLVYGRWWESLERYLMSHFGSYAGWALAKVGLVELGRRVYDAAVPFIEDGQRAASASAVLEGSTLDDVTRLLPAGWYFRHIDSMLAWPAVAFGVLGLARVVLRPSWTALILVAILAANLAAMSFKGSKDFRLWIPLLPFLAPLCAWGWAWLSGIDRPRPAAWRRLLGAAALFAALVLGIDILLARNTRRFSAYWQAIDVVGEHAATRSDLSREPLVASAYHWAVYLRESPDLELVKLPHQLDFWAEYDAGTRGENLAAIASLDYFITHLPVLTNHADLMQRVNRDFAVLAMFWDPETAEHIGPVFVLARRTGASRERTFFDVIDGRDPTAYRLEHRLPAPQRFVRRLGEHLEEVTLLGWQVEPLPGEGWNWITYHWLCGSEMLGDYTVVDRVTAPDERHAWQNDHAPAYGVHRTPSWEPGQIVREGWPLVPAADPYDWQSPFRPMGGAYRRGDAIPARLWIGLVTFGADREITGRMHPARAEGEELVRPEGATERVSPGGERFSQDGLIEVGRFFLPVHERLALPDDGRPLLE